MTVGTDADGRHRVKGAAGDGRTRVLLAVLGGCRSWGDVRATTGLAQGTVTRHLGRLRRDGLVAWTPGQQGTLRALVRWTPFGRKVAA